MRTRHALPVLVAAAGLLLVACGDDDTDAGAEPPASPDPAAAEAGDADADAGGNADLPDPCSLLSEADVAEVVPGATRTGPTDTSTPETVAKTCMWAGGTSRLSLILTTGPAPDALELALDTTVGQYDGRRIDVGGESAGVYSTTDPGATVDVIHDGTVLTVDFYDDQTPRSEAESKVIALATHLADQF